MFILRHLFFFVLQFAAATLVIVGLCSGYVLYEHGLDFRHTEAFAADLRVFVRSGMLGAGIFCLILFAYHSAKPALDAAPPPDNSLF